MNRWLFFITPPLMGAIIGYLTNAVAIKMLFRPHREKRIGRVRIPFTPGVLPRERKKLADSIGSMVEEKLLTPEILMERLHQADVQENIAAYIAGATRGILSASLNRVEQTRAVRDFLASADFSLFLDSLVAAIFSSMEQSGYGIALDKSIQELLGETTMQSLIQALRGLTPEGAPQTGSLLKPVLERNFPYFAAAMIGFLKKNEIHHQLEVQGRIFLDNAIQKLSTFQRFFISAGQYDLTILERMPEIIDDLIVQLEVLLDDKAIQDRIISYFLDQAFLGKGSQIVADFLSAYTKMPLGTLLGIMGIHTPQELSRLLKSLLPQDVSGALKNAASLFLRDFGQVPLQDWMRISDEAKQRLDAYLLEWLFSAADMHLATLLGTINIKTMVSERIDTLDMIDVEHIVLDVMANQLKWINIFGAILGALIGLFQSLFIHFVG